MTVKNIERIDDHCAGGAGKDSNSALMRESTGKPVPRAQVPWAVRAQYAGDLRLYR